MKNIINHLKTSGIGTTSGMICYSGGQYLNTAIADNFLKTLCLFGLMTAMGVCSKLLMDKLAKKKDNTILK